MLYLIHNYIPLIFILIHCMLNDKDISKTFIYANSPTKIGKICTWVGESANGNKIIFDDTN